MTRILEERFDGPNGVTISTANSAYKNSINLASSTFTFDTSITDAVGEGCGKVVQTSTSGTCAPKPNAFTATNTIYQEWCSRIGALPNGNFYIAGLVTGGVTTVARVAINSTGKVFLQDGTTTVATGTATLAANTWYRFEWDLVGTTSTVRVYAGQYSTTLVDTITATVAGNTFTQTQLGIVASANSNLMTHWIDEHIVDTVAQPGYVKVSGSFGFHQ